MELTITSITEEAPGVKTFGLQPVADDILRYKAGQFLTFIHTVHGWQQRRSYSLSGAPGLHEYARITVKRIANGFLSRWLIDNARTGDRLISDNGATGVFTLPDDLAGHATVWLFAAGIGITPIFALLEELLHNSKASVVLVYSNHSVASTVFYHSLIALETQFSDRLTIAWLWSDAQNLLRARLSKESFPVLLRDYLKGDPSKVLCYVCGPTSYMWLVQLLLQDAGVAPERVRREVFIVEKDVPKRLPADKGPHQITVQMGGVSYSFMNVFPDTILTSAKSASIRLPYSCESGQCGSCTAICSKGTVWMSYNEVLTEKDLGAGRILTCTGHAVGGDVVLELGGSGSL